MLQHLYSFSLYCLVALSSYESTLSLMILPVVNWKAQLEQEHDTKKSLANFTESLEISLEIHS